MQTSLLGALILLATASSNAPTPFFQSGSNRAPADFGACFARAQDRSGRGWAFLPAAHGGTFTDVGAGGAAASYWLQVRGDEQASRVRLYVAQDSRASPALIQAIDQCR